MFYTTNRLFIVSLLSSTFLFSTHTSAQILPDVNINLNTPVTHTGDVVALSVTTPVNTVNLNVSNGTFKQSVYGNRLGIENKSVINVSGGTIEGDVVGLERNILETGKILQSNTINVSGGTIQGNVLATKDTNNYNGTDRRDSNNINFSGGGIGGRIEGGAGAANNIITVTGGTLEKTSDGHSHDANYCDGNSGSGNDGNTTDSCRSGTIYAGVSDATTKNQSTNGTVILRNMNNSNSFLSTFTDGSDDLSGMIFGSNLTGTSNMSFENVDGTYKGGFKNFDNMLVDNNSNLILGGTAYYADNWKVEGSLDTNGKIAHTYKNTTLKLDVSGTGSLTQQFLSDANVNATNEGSIKGIKTDKNINLTNSGNMTGEYSGSTVNINNSGIINSSVGQSTTISSTNPGVLNNTGQIKETVSFTGQTTVNNNAGGLIDALIINAQNTLNINNAGTIDGTSISNLDGTKIANINNNSGGIIQNGLTLTNGTLNLNNQLGGNLTENPFTTNAGAFNISNSGDMSGNSSLTATNGGTFSLVNNATGNLTGDLTINSGLGTFSNAGTIHDLTLNNHINGIHLSNSNIITGNNVITNEINEGIIIDNSGTGTISGILNNAMGDLSINNASGGKLQNLTMMVSGTGNAYRIENSGIISGNNTINVTNSNGRVIIGNNAGAEITGSINNINGSEITNHDGARIHDLSFTNNQENTGITNYGDISNLSLTNTDNSKYMTIFNFGENNVGEIKDNLTVDNGTLYLFNTGLVKDANIVAQNGARIDIYNTTLPPSSNSNGTISGTNTFEGKDTSTIYVTNRTAGTITGTFNVKNGTTISNQGLIDGLTTNNSQNVLNFTNNAAGVLANTLTFNNSDENKMVNLSNRSSDILNGELIINKGTLNLNNGAESTINGYAITTNDSILNVNNDGTISGTNSITNTNSGPATLTNNGYASLGGTLTAKNGILNIDNQYAGKITNLDLKADTGTVNVSNNGIIEGNTVLKNANNGTINLTNQLTGTIKDNLVVESGLDTFANLGTISDLTLTNQQVALNLNNTGVISGTNAFNNSASGNTITLNNNAAGNIGGILSSSNGTFNINNNINAFLHDLNYTNNGSTSTIINAGEMSGNNSLANTAGTLSLTNASGGIISGGLTLNGGLNSLENNSGGTIADLTINSNQNIFTINNSGSIVNSNVLNANDEIKIVNNNTGSVNSNLTINAPITTLEQHSSGEFLANIYGSSSTNTLNLTNSTLFDSSLNGNMGTVNLTNDNVSSTSTTSLTNNGTIHNNLNVDNDGYTTINNNGTILAALSDASSPIVADTACPLNTLELNNSGNISGNMSVLNNIFKFDNTATGNVTSETIDTRDLRLTNAGNISSANNYAFSVRGNVEATNAASGVIYGKDYAFKLLGKPVDGSDVKGVINNNGVIYSQGTTIGYDGIDVTCPSCYSSDLVINNYGRLVSVDVATLTNPDLNSYAVSAENAVVNNYSGGLVGGSIHAKEYNQKAGATWVTFLDKDLTKMSTILAEDKISIESGSVLSIYTNNNVKAFTNNQEFKLVEAKNMGQDEIDAEIEKFTIHTDSPFANYQMMGKNNDEGYIVFNHVAPTTFASSTDLATASHNATILGSQRMYELFVNRDVNQIQGLASGDSFNTTNKLNFMPIGGYAHQGDKDGHAGYDTNYYGGMGYWEHDFSNNFKGGLGFAYMNNSTDFNDADGSNGNIDSYRPFAYINYENGPWRFDLAGGAAKHKVDNNRKYSFNDVGYNSQGKYDADEISGHLNVGYKMVLDNNIIVQPMIGAYAAQLKTDTFDETGSGPMNMHVESEDYNSFKSMLGVKLKKDYELDDGTMVTPELHVRWYHELSDTKGGVSAFFLAQEQLFNTSGIETPKDVGDIAFRLTTKTGTNMDLFTEAYYQFGDKFYNIGGTVGLQYNF